MYKYLHSLYVMMYVCIYAQSVYLFFQILAQESDYQFPVG